MSEYTLRQKLAFSLLGVKDEEQKNSIRLVLSGEKYVRDDIDAYWKKYLHTKREFFEKYNCTVREIEVGKISVLAQKGFSQKKIAEILGLSKTQVNSRCKKYGIVTLGMKQ